MDGDRSMLPTKSPGVTQLESVTRREVVLLLSRIVPYPVSLSARQEHDFAGKCMRECARDAMGNSDTQAPIPEVDTSELLCIKDALEALATSVTVSV